jgi:hypothetical protein
MRRLLPFTLIITMFSVLAGAHPVAPSRWIEGAALPEGREGTAGGFIDGKFYVTHGFGGSDRVDNAAYDPLFNTWQVRAPAAVPRSELSAAVVDGLLYTVGGRDLSGALCQIGVCNTLEIYDPATDSWTKGTSMPTPRAGLGVAASGGKIYAVGGRTGTRPRQGAALDILEIYDIATGTWSSGPPMKTPRMDVYATVAYDRGIWVIGGYNPSAGYLASVEIFDPLSGLWFDGPPMPTPRSNAVAGVCDEHLFVVGGDNSSGSLTVVEQYHGQWTSAAPMPKPGAEFAAGAVSGDGVIFAAGSGIDGIASSQNLVMSCSPTTVRIESGTDEYVNSVEAQNLQVTGATLPDHQVSLDLKAQNGGALLGNTLSDAGGAFAHSFGDVHGKLADGPIGVIAIASGKEGPLLPATDSAILDVTPPTITYVGQEPPANGDGWTNGPTTFTWTCTDETSGPVSPTVTKTVSSSGENQSVTGTCFDRAGNSSSNTRTGINIDMGPPICSVQGPILSTDTVTGSCGDDLSGVAFVETLFTNLLTLAETTSPATCADCSGGKALLVIWITPTTKLQTGFYLVRARARDRAGNVGPYSQPILVFVVGAR